MAYFTNLQDYLFLCSDLSSEEKQKLDNYLRILEYSGVGRIIAETVTKSIEKGGRPFTIRFVYFPPYYLHFQSIREVFDALKTAFDSTHVLCI